MKWLRRIVAGAILAGIPIGIWTGGLESCVGVRSAGEIEETCSAPDVGDAVVVVPALLALILLLPDMGEVTALGITLRGRVEKVEQSAREAESRDEAMASMLSVLQQQLNFVNTNAAASAAASNQTVFYLSGDRLSQVEESLPEKGQRFSEGLLEPSPSGRPATPTAGSDSDDVEYARVGGQLIQRWEELREAVGLGLRTAKVDALPPDVAERRRRFSQYFAEEIELVRAARNAFAHASSVTTDDVKKALDICDQLLAYWYASA